MWKLSVFNVAPYCISQVFFRLIERLSSTQKALNKKCMWMFADIWVKNCLCSMLHPCCISKFRPRLIERLRSNQNTHQQKVCVNVCWYLGEKLPPLLLPPYCISQAEASTHRKFKLNRRSPWTKKVCECLLIFGWKTVSIQFCPLILYPRFRPRPIERLSLTQKAHQEKMCVNFCWYLGEKLSLINVAPLFYIPGLGLDS